MSQTKAQLVDNTKVTYTASGTGAAARTVDSKLGDIVSVKDFGAVGDGVADDTAAIQAALNYGATGGYTVTAAGTFKISSKVTIKGNVDFSNAIFNVYGTPAIALEISTGNASNPTTILNNSVIWLPKRIDNMTKPATGWAAQGIGVRVVNTYSCQIFVGNVLNFSTGLLVTSFNAINNAYNNFYLGHLENNKVNLSIAPDNTAPSAANENNFIGGRLSHYSLEGTNVSGTRQILLAKSVSTVNNNLFIKPSIEGATAEYHIENGGSANTFQQARWEAIPAKVLYTADNVNQATNNTIIGGYQAEEITFSFAGSSGFYNQLIGVAYNNYASGSSTTGSFKYVSGSNAYPIQTFYPAGTNPEIAGSTVWTMRHSANGLSGKATGQSYATVYLDYANGYIKFGDGVSAPDVGFRKYNPGDLRVTAGTSFQPETDNATSFGTAGIRWSVIYAGTGTINTSDEREKQDIAALDDAEKRVATAIKGLIRKYRFRNAVAVKGDNARIHVGVIVQDVIAAFEVEGLDPMSYGIVCYDQWDAELDQDGNETRPAGDRYGIRYEELLAFIISAL